jgi:transposase
MICKAYKNAAEKWEKEGIKTVSTDEKTGIQALERTAKDLPMKAGHICKREYEYNRHGTKCLIANFDVVEGKIICPSITEKRTEVDFYEHVKKTVESDKSVKKWRFIADNLNTHQSETLVRYVAQLNEIPQDSLGEKGKSGILENMETRSDFLRKEEHTIFFIYTPKHCSWLNQIEIWFGILCRKVIKRGNFTSKDDLTKKIEDFIDYFNVVLAKPFKWTYDGKPCRT